MGSQFVEKSNRQIFEIIPVARNQATPAFGGAVEVLLIGKRGSIFLACANRVDSVSSEYFCDCWTEIGVEIVLH